MKKAHFKVSNTGKARSQASPSKSNGIKHSSSGANQPAAYAHEVSVVNRISNRLMHVKPKKGW